MHLSASLFKDGLVLGVVIPQLSELSLEREASARWEVVAMLLSRGAEMGKPPHTCSGKEVRVVPTTVMAAELSCVV